ncbi:MAG TPA: VanW family protein [Gaiellaceae bacterium]|nr:VanW family protein [Gaiellaceae bacterium]
MYAEAGSRAVYLRRKRAARRRLVWQWSVVGILALSVLTFVLSLGFAGSATKLPDGATIAGMDVGGLSTGEAVRTLERRYEALKASPAVFTAGPRRWRIRPNQVILNVDWAAAVETARRQGDGFAPVRGLRRLGTRFFGADVTPHARVSPPMLAHTLDLMSRRIDRPQRDAAIRLRGLQPEIVRGATGRELDREGAARLIVSSLVSLERTPTELPVRISQPDVTAAHLAPALQQVRTAVSAPVRLALGATRWRLPRWRIAKMLVLPRNGGTTVSIGGSGANAFFERFRASVDRTPADAEFVILPSDRVIVRPAKPGLELDVAAAAKAIQAAALSATDRVARLAVERAHPQLTTREARAMGITGRVAGYTTYYGGVPNRIHNVQLVARLIDGATIAPGATFSFNGTTGERSPDRGFREAPVIINGELQNGIGGGVCQVSTTVFNAAYEAGLPIESRTNHALYISHYPQGRDATVNYPDLDLKFRNDTGKWLLLRTFVGSSALTVKLYGTPQNRRVESETTPLEVTGGPGLKRIPDPNLWAGVQVVDDYGEPSRKTSVTRLVYSPQGRLLSEDTWTSWYRSEPKIVRYGTKPRPKQPSPPPPPKDKGKKTPPPPPPPGEPTPPPPPPPPA